MNDEQRGAYLRMLDAEAKRHAREIGDREAWALDRHMGRVELAVVRAWRRLMRVLFRA